MFFEDFHRLLDVNNTSAVNRRDALKLGLAGALAASVPLLGAGEAQARGRDDAWRVSFRQAHTGEAFNGVYRVGDKYLPEAFERLNYVLRDFRTKEVFPMDPRIIDVLSLVQAKTNTSRPFEILSGYRSPKTNSNLRRNTSGVAKNSFHMYGQALDIRVPGVRTSTLRSNAMSLKAGGVGYYPKSGFVHIDTGTVRTWS